MMKIIINMKMSIRIFKMMMMVVMMSKKVVNYKKKKKQTKIKFKKKFKIIPIL